MLSSRILYYANIFKLIMSCKKPENLEILSSQIEIYIYFLQNTECYTDG